MTRTNEEDRHVAIHEAGHAVAHHWYEHEIKIATIQPDEEEGSRGHVELSEGNLKHVAPDVWGDSPCSHAELAHLADLLANASELSTHQVNGIREVLTGLASMLGQEEDIVTSFAGEAATFILTGDNDPVGAGRSTEHMSGDTRAVWEVVVRLFECGEDEEAPNSREAWAYWERMWWHTVCLLRRPHVWTTVEAVAEALLERRTLTGSEIAEVIRQAAERDRPGNTPPRQAPP